MPLTPKQDSKAATFDVLYSIDAPHFCAGFTTLNGCVFKTAPILKWMKGKMIADIMLYCIQKDWKLEKLGA